MQSAADFATRPRPPTRALARRPITSNRDPGAGEASTPLTALPVTPRAHLRRARERASFDGGGGSSTPLTQLVDSPLSQLHSSGTGRARAGGQDGQGQVHSAVSATAAQVDQVATRLESTTTPEAKSAPTEPQQTASELDECNSVLGGHPRDPRVPTTSAAVPTPSAEPTRSPNDPDDLDPTGRVSGGTASPETLVEAVDGATGVKGPYGSLTRDDLEYLLSEADRVIREKEQELATFTAAGQGLLDEYNRLRQEHVALAPATSRSAPPSAQSSPTQFRQRGIAPAFDLMDGDRIDGLTHLNSTAPDQGRQVSLDYSPERSRKESGIRATTWLTPRSATGRGASPTSLRSQDKSGIISTVSRSGSSRILFSPAGQAKETAVLSQANYTLTLQLSEVQAESEAAEREGRKKLRKLERELQSLRADLERVEQRNAILEAQTELAKTKQTGSLKASRACRATPGRALESPITPEKSRVQRTPSTRYSGGGGSGGGSPFYPRLEGAPYALGNVPRTDQQEMDRPHLLFPHPAPIAPLDDPARNMSPALLQRPVYRTVSSSSLVPLPPPVHLDPSLEKQQDELVDQLMAKIDELQDTNHVFLTEREHMFHRLNEAQEEVYEWKERCEELEDENQQHRLIGWRNDVENTSHAWLDFDDAEGAVVAYEPEGPAADDGRSARSLMEHSHVDSPPHPSFSAIEGTANEVWASQQPDWPTTAARSLKDELEPMCAPSTHADDHAPKPTTTSSLVIRKPSEDLDRGRECQDRLEWPCSSKAAQTTRDDLLPSGSLRYSGHPSAEKYEVLERAATALEPTWADAHLPAAHQSRMTLLHEAKRRIGGASDRVEKLTSSDRARKPVLRISENDDPELAPSSSVSAAGPRASSRTVATTNLRRRRRALRRLDHEASLRKSGQEMILHRDTTADSDSGSDGSSTSSDFDMLEHSLRRRSDYQPMDRLSRLRPSAVVARAVDSAGHHVFTLFTWLRFMILLSTAVVFAIWQGPQKTLGLAGGRPRQLQ